MRLDKFLKVSRLIKRRTIAKQMCEGGRIKLNGRVAKSSSKVREDDEIVLSFGNRSLKVKVLNVPEGNVSAKEASSLYDVLEDIRSDENDFEPRRNSWNF